MAHTQSPWTLDCRDRHSPTLATGGYHTIDAGDRVHSPERGYVGFSIAGFMSDEDARLIAAAPDLLAALENMMGAYDTPVSRRRYPPDEFITEALQSARAAIARARGTEVA